MINYVTGVVTSLQDKSLTLEVGPFGLEVMIAVPTMVNVGQSIKLYLHMHWNQENGPSFYGFLAEAERQVFLLAVDCSGIGPKIGLAIIEHLGVQRFIETIKAEDEKSLSKVSGIGPKKAEQMIVQLKHKVAKVEGLLGVIPAAASDWNNVSEVLESLNYSRSEISLVMRHLRDTVAASGVLPFDQMLRKALSFLAKKP